MGGYVLWGGGPTRSILVEAVLGEIGAPYELREVDIRKGGHEMPEFRALNPFGWVPALTTPEGETIGETPAITLWLCERHRSDLVPAPGDADRGRFLSAFHNVVGEIEPTMKRIFFAHRYVLCPEDTAAGRDQAWAMLDERIGLIESLLGDTGPYFLGDRYTLADLTLAYWMAYAAGGGRLSQYPAVQNVLDATRSRPGAAAAFRQQADWIAKFNQRVANP